jgi:HEAT repeat protein
VYPVLKKFFIQAIIPLLLIAGCSKSSDDFIKDLSSNSAVNRSMAATTLSGMRDHATTEKLVALLKSKDDRLVFIVAQVLGSRADTLAIQPLGEAAKHSNPFIRAKAIWSIGSIGHASGLPFLVEACKDSSAVVRHTAVMAIGFLHYAPAAAALYPMLRDEADSVRTAAIQSLYSFRKTEGSGVMAADLAIALHDPAPVVRYVAVQALGGGFPDTTVAGELLIEALRDENKDVRVEAISSLKNIAFKKAVPVLKKMFDTASVDEEYAISEAVKGMTGEDYPPEAGK